MEWILFNKVNIACHLKSIKSDPCIDADYFGPLVLIFIFHIFLRYCHNMKNYSLNRFMIEVKVLVNLVLTAIPILPLVRY